MKTCELELMIPRWRVKINEDKCRRDVSVFILTYYIKQCPVSKCGQMAREACQRHHIPQGPIAFCSHTLKFKRNNGKISLRVFIMLKHLKRQIITRIAPPKDWLSWFGSLDSRNTKQKLHGFTMIHELKANAKKAMFQIQVIF